MSDVDGFSSASIFYNYLMDHLSEKYNFTIDVHIPEGKEHGLRTIYEDLLDEKKYDLIVVPDAGTNDVKECQALSEVGYDILLNDHHVQEERNPYAVVINNQPSKNYQNKELVGAGVVLKFFQYFDRMEGTQFFIDYIDLAMFAQISDMFPLQHPESRLIFEYGITHINNKFLKAFIEKQSCKLKGGLTQIGFSFYITPLINALIRMGNDIQKERLFEAFTNPDKQVPSTKTRNKTSDYESVVEQTIRNCFNAKEHQTRERERATELLDIQIMENCLDDNKILILDAGDLEIPRTLTGLCAMGIASKYKRPVLLGRINRDGVMKGSIRNVQGSELSDLRQFLLSSGFIPESHGHANAGSFMIKESDIDKFTSYANEALANIDFNEKFYDVDFIVQGNSSILSDLIENLDEGKCLWGQGNPEPVIAVENIYLDTNDVDVIGKNKNAIRFKFNGITYVKTFGAEDIIHELNRKSGKMKISVVGKGNINVYNGQSTTQILIDGIEINSTSDIDF